MEPVMVDVPAGTIVLRDEGTRTGRPVEVAPFRLAAHPVTRELHARVLGKGPAPAPRAPVTEVSWLDAVRFCNLLSQHHGLAPAY
ncbi:hypothetical protein [Geodermatophilus sp. SYSU D00815]